MRSRRPAMLLAIWGLCVGLAFGAAGVAVLFLLPRAYVVAACLGFAGLLDLALAGWVVLRIRRTPGGRLALFRDRMVLIQGRTEMRALWDRMELVTLAEPAGSWAEVNLTDTVTIRLRGERPLTFRPAAFGMDPVACRDLLLKLRDEPSHRARLPEFDSALDLRARPVGSR